VERVTECNIATDYGDFRLIAYQDIIDNEVHLALVKGTPRLDQPVLVRVHMNNALCDLLGLKSAGCGWPLHNAMRQIAEEGAGIIVILRNRDRAREIAQRIRDLQLAEAGYEVPRRVQDGGAVLRTYGVGAQILLDLGVRRMRVLSAPKSMHGLSGFDLEVVEYVECH
jgi:3,4-dihydroxy 2-butanone 4-phosphate synthase/GTP cyclohydrolase II